MKTIAYSSFFFNVLLFATYYAASKDALFRIDPVMFAGFELIVLLPVALGIVWLWRKQLSKNVITRGVLLGSCLGGVFFSLAVALKYTTATETAFFPCLNGIFAAIVSWAVLRQRVSLWTWGAALLAMLGMALMIGAPLHTTEWRGDVAAFLGGMTYTGYIFLVDALLVDHSPDGSAQLALWPVLGVQLLTLCALALVCIFLFGNWQAVRPQMPKDLWAVLWVGMTVLLPTITSPFMQKYVDPTTIAFIYILEPLISAVVAFLYLGEVLSLHSYIGAGLVLVAALSQTAMSTLFTPRLERIGLDREEKSVHQKRELRLMWWKSTRKVTFGLIISLLLLLLLVSATLNYPGLLLVPGVQPVAAAGKVVGHIFFESSGQLKDQSQQGESDEVLIDLQHIPAPAAGKSYYAWLLSDNNQGVGQTILLGTLSLNQGDAHLFYAGDAQHTNLLAITSRFLITEQDASALPAQPSLDMQTWRYYAQISQAPNPYDTINHFSLLDHLRHLLVADPRLDAHELPGGLAIWTYHTTQKVLENASAARDLSGSNDPGAIRRCIIRILDYLDGSSYVQADVPAGTPVLIDPHMAQVGLLEFDAQHQNPPGYLYHIASHLAGLVRSPGVSFDQQETAVEIHVGLNNVGQWLEQVHQDAKKLEAMSDQQLLLPSSLSILDDLVTHANNAYVGALDPSTNTLQAGVTQIYSDIERLATMDVTTYQIPPGYNKFIAITS